MLETTTVVANERYLPKETIRIPEGSETLGNDLTKWGRIDHVFYGGHPPLVRGSDSIPVGGVGGCVTISFHAIPVVRQDIPTCWKHLAQRTGNELVQILPCGYGSGNEQPDAWISLSSSQAPSYRRVFEQLEELGLSHLAPDPTVEEPEKSRHPLDVPTRLDKFRELKDGWADGMQYAGDWGNGYGKAPSPAGLDWLTAAFTRHYPADAPLPYTYPTPEGGVQMEWSLGVQDISLEVNLETGWAWWHRLDMSTDNDEEQVLNLNSDGWIWLGAEIMRWSG